MKIILFDLGNTLEYKNESRSILRPDALEVLKDIESLHDNNGEALVLSLVSDWNKQADEYHNLLKDLNIDNFFEPFSKKVTLSNDNGVGVTKPDEKIFRVAIDKIQRDLNYKNVLFITENKDHIIAARKYGMMAIRLNFPGKTD